MTDCPRCGNAAAEGQDYCLACGARLSAGRRSPTRRSWLARIALAGAVALIGAAAAVAATRDTAGGEHVTTALGGFTTSPAETTLPAPTGSGDAILADWPAGVDGWTIVLASYPQTAGRTDANATARKARRRGLTEVGVLDSSRYASLHPGYWVVFAGVYGSEAEATSALENARKLSRDAAVRRIVP